MNTCPFCKTGALVRRTKQQTYTYKNQTMNIQQPGDWCDNCEEGVLTNSDTKETEKHIRDFHSRVNGLLTSMEIKNIRARLRLTQKQAAYICGGGPNAFSRYERGEATPIRATSNLLKLLAKYPTELSCLLPSNIQSIEVTEESDA